MVAGAASRVGYAFKVRVALALEVSLIPNWVQGQNREAVVSPVALWLSLLTLESSWRRLVILIMLLFG
jgi:hypothetical protein